MHANCCHEMIVQTIPCIASLFTVSSTPNDSSVGFAAPGKDSPILNTFSVVFSSITKILCRVAPAELNIWASLIAVQDPAIPPPTIITSYLCFCCLVSIVKLFLMDKNWLIFSHRRKVPHFWGEHNEHNDRRSIN